jgi:putative endonuclease
VIWNLFQRGRKSDATTYAPHVRGRAAEDLALRYLEQHGLQLVTRNFRCTRGEIDLIMRHGDSLVFVEVRARRNDNFGSGAASVDARKQAKLNAAAALYLQQNAQLSNCPCRFDVVALSFASDPPQLDWIPDAFGATHF